MEDADLRFWSEVPVDAPGDARIVPEERLDIVCLEVADRVPAVVSEVVQDQIETGTEQRPEGIVRVRGQSGPVAHDEPWTVRIAVPPEDQQRAVVCANLGSGVRLG